MPNEMLKMTNENRLQEILRTSIKLLCQSSIKFNAQMTIQGLIGVTVDGSEVLLVNVQEQIDKQQRPAPTTASLARYDKSTKNVSNFDCTTRNASVSSSRLTAETERYDDGVKLTDDKKGNLDGSGFFDVKQEDHGVKLEDPVVLDDNYAGDEDYSTYDNEGQEYENEEQEYENGEQEYENEEYDESTAGYNDQNEEYFESPATNNDYGWQDTKPSTSTFVRSDAAKRRRQAQRKVGVKKQKVSAPVKIKHDARLGEDHSNYTNFHESGESTVKGNTTVLASERNQVFTCSICGKSIQNYNSFVRHKKLHDGTVYRCDICGTVVNRRDNLISHRRRCEMRAIQLEASNT